MHSSVVYFTQRVITEDMVKGKVVLEVGAKNVNGSLREWISTLHPLIYTGTDMQAGAGVDKIIKAEELTANFSYGTFNLVICTETLEHVKEWRKAINNIKDVLSPDGFILITARGKEMGYHPYPDDYWRYDTEVIAKIFADYDIWALEQDTEYDGVLMLAKKRGEPRIDLKKIELAAVAKVATDEPEYSDDVASEIIVKDDIKDYKAEGKIRLH